MLSTPVLVRALGALAVSTGLLTAPGAAGASSLTGGDVAVKDKDKDKEKDKDKDEEAPVETAVGCFNIVNGKGGYTKADTVGRLRWTFVLDETSCTDVMYRLEAYDDPTGGGLLDSKEVRGLGLSNEVPFDLVFSDSRPSALDVPPCIYLVGTTQDATGAVHDIAPDHGRYDLCHAGATASFK